MAGGFRPISDVRQDLADSEKRTFLSRPGDELFWDGQLLVLFVRNPDLVELLGSIRSQGLQYKSSNTATIP